MTRTTEILIDVTSLISAEEFLLSQNNGSTSADPFARQCFVEVVQSLIFMSRTYVPHPVLFRPAPADFGERPLLLRSLMRAGLLHPLQIGSPGARVYQQLEDSAIRDLSGGHGLTSMIRFIEQARDIDNANAASQEALLTRIHAWCEFQDNQVRPVKGHHSARIRTPDGVEEDAFGEWARATAVVIRGPLEVIATSGRGGYLMANLARTMKYRARAQATGVSYQSHPLRRDFSLTFDLTRDGASEEAVFDVIRAVRGIHETLTQAVGPDGTHRLRLIALELPLLGGRLWASSDLGHNDDRSWVDLVVGRIADYRDRAADLRHAVERCVSDEDRLRVARDIDDVKFRLLDRLGLRHAEPSAVEREIVSSVASVASAAPGIPVVSGLWFAARSLGRQYTYPGALPYQRFLYREFIDAWKRAGK